MIVTRPMSVAVNRFDELADRLDAIVDELDELAFDQLSEAVHDGATSRPGRRQAARPGAACGREGRRTCCGGSLRRERVAVERVDQRPQVAVPVLGELEGDPGEIDVVVLAALDRERLDAPDRARRRRGGRTAR